MKVDNLSISSWCEKNPNSMTCTDSDNLFGWDTSLDWFV